MNKYLSTKIKIISFIAIIMVVFLHCYNFKDNFLTSTTIIYEGLNYGTFIEYFLCNGLTRVAVPLFFMISGYLFFLSFKMSGKGYFKKVKSRFKTLFIPYVLWTAISVGICFVFWNVDIMPVNDMKGNLELGGDGLVFLNPPNFQFWFVKQLIVFTILSPIFYLLLKFKVTRILSIIVSTVLWAMDKDMILNIIQVEALLFFVIGSSLSIAEKKELVLKDIKKNVVIKAFAAWIGILIVKTIICGMLSVGDSTTVILILHKLSIVVGIFAVWFGLDYVMKNKEISEKIATYSPHTFFIFCFHEPLLDFVIQYTLINIADNTFINLVTFIIYPSVTIVLAILISKFIIRYIPVIHDILTGNRGTRKI